MTSIFILEGQNTFKRPVFEYHFRQAHNCEAFSHHSCNSHRADAVIAGFGHEGYVAGIRRICQLAAH
ncbi:MAG TPA: type II 3-dehydroquinate dehydratase [Paracoccaceae bacterium]|nr:type II 3-dehydroquinate dehydratase [Paracoccaceae bacterium]